MDWNLVFNGAMAIVAVVGGIGSVIGAISSRKNKKKAEQAAKNADNYYKTVTEYVNHLLEKQKIQQNNVRRDELKQEIFKQVSLSGIAKTQAIADKVGVSKEEAFELLRELLLVDGKISCGGRATEDDIENVIWVKKK